MITKEIEKIIKKVQLESDKRLEKILKRHTGALLEEFQDRVSGIAEQYGDIKNTLDHHTEMLDIHTEMIGSLATDMTEVKSDIRDIKSQIKLILDTKADKKDFVNLDRRVSILEKK